MHIFQDELKRVSADLEITNRGLKVSPLVTKSNEIDITFLSDLHFLCNWLKEHSEVKYIHVEMDVQDLRNPTFNNLEELHQFRVALLKLRKEVQMGAGTWIFSGSGSYKLYWSEFLSLFEKVLLTEGSDVLFDHTLFGMIPILEPEYIARKLRVSTSSFLIPQKLNLSFSEIVTLPTKDRNVEVKKIKEIIFKQSELSKIQMKSSLIDPSNHQQLFNGNLSSGDWSQKDKKFQKLRDLKELSKMEAASGSTKLN